MGPSGDNVAHFVFDGAHYGVWIVWTEIVVSKEVVVEFVLGANGVDVGFRIFDVGKSLGVMDVHGVFDRADG